MIDRYMVIGWCMVALGIWGAMGHHKARNLQERLDETTAQIGQIRSERDHALTAADACSSNVARLSALAQEQERAAQQAIEAAAQQAQSRERRAQSALSAPPAVPGNDCASARVRVGTWLKGRQS